MILSKITSPNMIWGRNVVFMIDNMAVMFGCNNSYVKNDKPASVVLRAIRCLAGNPGVTVFVKHVDRMSDDLANLADEISRKESNLSDLGREILSGAEYRCTKGALTEWLKDPNQPDLSIKLINGKYPMM